METRKTVRVTAHALGRLLEDLFLAVGCSPENARLMAAGFMEGDLRGHRIQGIDHVVDTLEAVESGRLHGTATPCVVRETPATAQVDGGWCPGHVGAFFASDLAIAKARKSGACVVGLVAAGDVYMLSNYVDRIARAGLAGMAFTNSFEPDVHPIGGIERLLGTNPIAFGFPSADENPIIMDLATSATAIGHVRIASYYDEPIREGLALGPDGEPTTDSHRALQGVLAPMAGHKGYALGLAVAFMAGPLIGAVVGEELAQVMASPPAGRVGARGHCFVAIDPSAFGDPQLCRQRIARHATEIRGSRRARGVERIYLPGERGHEERARALKEGILVWDQVWNRTASLARRYGVQLPDPI